MSYRMLAGAAASALLLAGTATADDHGRRGHDRHDDWSRDWDSRYYSDRHHHHHDDDDDDAALLVGGAIVGLALGAALADQGSQPPSSGYYDNGPDPYAYPPPDYGYYTPPPAYYQPPRTTYTAAPCAEVKSGRTAAGAVTGAVIGGLLGNGVAANKNRSEGAAVGAAAGALIGGSIGSSSANCGASGSYSQAGYQGGYAQPQGYDQPYYGGSDDSGLLGGPLVGGPLNASAPGGDCKQSMRTTTLPDGRQLREPVTVCRDSYNGGWRVEN